MRIALALWVAGPILTGAAAQELRWRLPPLGAAEFARDTAARSGTAETARAAQQAATATAVPERFLPRLLPAPWLCQGELDRTQRSIADPPRELRDLMRAVALDLGVRGSCRWSFRRVPPYGDLIVRGTAGAPGPDGSQELRLQIERTAPAAMEGDGRDGRALAAQVCSTDLRGSLLVQRTLDVDRGLVREFAATLDVVVTEGPRAFRRIVVHDRWRFLAVRENQDADFRKRVAAAVDRGAAFVQKALGDSASYLDDRGDDDRSFGSGRLALALLTLLHAGIPREDPVLVRGFAALRRRRLVDTYSLGVALLALSALHAPPREAEQVRTGQLAARAPRRLPERDLALAREWSDRLLRNADRRVDPARVLRFNYVAGPRFDNSLSQYGMLGLDAAALCGVEVPASAWAAAVRHFAAVQCPAAGGPVALQLVTHRDLAASSSWPPPEPRARRVEPRGHAYQDPDEPPYGGMTAAAITGLLLARTGAAATGTDLRVCDQADEAIAAAFAWLAQQFTVRANPGFVGKADRHWYYWLYCLERACELAGVAHLQGRDWYYEGALQLLAQQQPNGSFRAEQGGNLLIDTTCFSVLFLAKGTPAVVTGR